MLLKIGLRTFALAPKTYILSFFHLSFLSMVLFSVFYNEHQRFFQGAYSRSNPLFSVEIMRIGKSLPEKLFACLVGFEGVLLLLFVPLLFGDYFQSRSAKGTLEWLCASPYSCEKILRLARKESFLSLSYFLLPTIPIYAICFIFGLSWSRFVFSGFLFLGSTACCVLNASLYLSLQTQVSLSFYRNLLVFSVFWWISSALLLLIYPKIPFFLLASFGPCLGSYYFFKAQSAERILLWLR